MMMMIVRIKVKLYYNGKITIQGNQTTALSPLTSIIRPTLLPPFLPRLEESIGIYTI